MNKYIYDAKTNAFYPLALKESVYEPAGMWPEGGVEVNERLFEEFQTPPTGKVRSADENGRPVWVDAPERSEDERIAYNTSLKNQLIDEANAFMNRNQWSGKAALGRITDDEKAQYNIWLDYLDEINKVNPANKKPKWPEKPA